MSCLFVHDFRSYYRDDDVYTGNLSYEILNERYVKTFGSLKILNRSGLMDSEDDPTSYVKASGPNVEFLDEIEVFTPISFFLNHNSYRRIVYKNVDKNDYIIIRLDSFLGLMAAKRCRTQRKNYLIEVVGCVRDSFWNKGVIGKIAAYPLMYITRREIKKAPYVVYVTERFLQHRYPTLGKSTNISNVLLPKHDDGVLRKRLDKIKRVDGNPYHIVTVASVSVRHKGQESVIKALGELKSRGYTNYIYHIIGDGDQTFLRKVSIKANVESSVIFHGRMNHEDVIRFIDNCDMYIQPSKQEGLPRALIEGMSRGLLCYGSNIAGIPELLESSCLFSAGGNNYLEIANLILHSTKELFTEQAIRNFQKVQEYENSKLSKKRESFFSDFVCDSNIKR